MSLIVPETSRLGLTDGQLVGTVAMLLKACDCDLDNFAISHSTARRQREMVNSKVSVDIMLKWVKMVKELGLKIILHYDGKLVEELERSKVKRIKYDRLSVIARLPEIQGPDSEQILGIPQIKNGKGITQTTRPCLRCSTIMISVTMLSEPVRIPQVPMLATNRG